MPAKAVLITGGLICYPKLLADTTRKEKDNSLKLEHKRSSGKKIFSSIFMRTATEINITAENNTFLSFMQKAFNEPLMN